MILAALLFFMPKLYDWLKGLRYGHAFEGFAIV
jgi:hypothetical protein